MKNSVLLGYKKHLIPIPGFIWKGQVRRECEKTRDKETSRLTDDQHRVREFAVSELHREGQPLSPDLIASKLDLPVPVVNEILDTLEKGMVYLFRKGSASVYWAYPVTVDKTPHFVTYSTGEEGCAA